MENKWTCPHCGGELDQKPKFCAYCGSPVKEEKPKATDLMEQAGTHMVGGRFLDARAALEQALEQEPENSDIWIMLLLCKIGKKDIDDLAGAKRLLSTYEEFNKAVEFANEHRKGVYRRLAEKNRELLLDEKKKMEEEMRQLHSRTEKRKWELKDMESRRNLPIWKKVLLIVEKVFVIANVAFWTFGTLFVLPIALFDAPFVVWLCFIISRDKKRKKAIADYPDLNTLQQEELSTLERRKREYKQWLVDTGLVKGEKADA